MNVSVTIELPKVIYDIYEATAETIGSCTAGQVISTVLRQYTWNIVDEMRKGGLLS